MDGPLGVDFKESGLEQWVELLIDYREGKWTDSGILFKKTCCLVHEDSRSKNTIVLKTDGI